MKNNVEKVIIFWWVHIVIIRNGKYNFYSFSEKNAKKLNKLGFV
jgi:hypothetical protein